MPQLSSKSPSESRVLAGVLLFLVIAACQQLGYGQWTKLESGTTAWLRSIYFLNERVGWIVGSRGTLLSTSDGGESWQRQIVPTKDNFRDVYFRDADNGWILAEADIYTTREGPLSYLLRTTDGGRNWRRQNFISERVRIIRFLFVNDRLALAFGEAGAIYRTQEPTSFDRWTRTAWSDPNMLLGGAFKDEENGFLVGGNGTIAYTTDRGSTWIKVNHPRNGGKKLRAAALADGVSGWIVGDANTILHTTDGGRTWEPQTSPVLEDWVDVVVRDSETVFIVGAQGSVLVTNSSGRIWKAKTLLARHGSERLAIAGGNAVVVGFGGLVLRESDPPSN